MKRFLLHDQDGGAMSVASPNLLSSEAETPLIVIRVAKGNNYAVVKLDLDQVLDLAAELQRRVRQALPRTTAAADDDVLAVFDALAKKGGPS